jgi:hypothetical protein
VRALVARQGQRPLENKKTTNALGVAPHAGGEPLGSEFSEQITNADVPF